MTDPNLPTRTEGEGETLDMPEGFGSIAKGQVLGERYQILEVLGRGGMGEVWHAFDLKLRVEVALKALRPEFFKSERRLELLRQEVRAAREVMSPNVCRIFDLIEIEGRELVSMEYVDGATLLGVLQERGPLELKEAQDIASQFLAGLEAIHKVGLVHRDIKPENIMLTRAGRVVVMDFGLARQETEGGGSVSGTPAYMAPEQAAGQTLDARADVYSAGVVLAEMVSPEGIKSYESRQSVWEGVRSEPAKLPDSPWAPAIKKAVARDRERRYNTAHTLVRALEDVTMRVEGAEDLHPYPGLASFTQDEAEYFFGREAEIEQMWRRLEGPPRMLGLVGPSGAGKSSFIGAGLLAAAPPGWSFVVCTPGNAAISSLGRAMAGEMAGDKEAFEQMVDFDIPDVAVEVLSRWGSRHDRALLIVDQFEELFTQNASDEQRRFADLLNRLVLEADIHVVLSMRDDFLMRCRDQEALKSIFADMTALPTLSGDALRRALVQPATKCGYRFEDDELVEEMLAEVEGERGALPLLAFAAARLWEMRDHETGLLTRQAYHDIGGVGGALARHAEATIDRIGTERVAIVRELFRNLVTAEGTRAVREWNELLSVFDDPQHESAEEVLRGLIDARLLTSYEVREDEHDPTRRVEIIHESLLANWPRLVRWQTQDADAVQLRDQLRQAAKTWDDQGRSDDTLWTGAAYREFASWRERYSGGLTEIEEAFAKALTSLATRRRRRRRFAVATIMVILLAVLAVVGISRRQAVTEARRARAQKLIAFGQVDLEGDPTQALAWARASLGVFDTQEARLFAQRALAEGPPARFLSRDSEKGSVIHGGFFSPDGSWIALEGYSELRVHRRSDGAVVLEDTFPAHEWETVKGYFDLEGRLFHAYHGIGEFRTYTLPGFTEIHRQRLTPPRDWLNSAGPRLLLEDMVEGGWVFERWRPPEEPQIVARLPKGRFRLDGRLEHAAFIPRSESNRVYLRSIVAPEEPPRLVHQHSTPIGPFHIHPELAWIAIRDRKDNTISLWPFDGQASEPSRHFQSWGLNKFVVDESGRFLMESEVDEGQSKVALRDLRLPDEVVPLLLKTIHTGEAINRVTVDPGGRWVVGGVIGNAVFWPLNKRPNLVFADRFSITAIPAFSPDGSAVLAPAGRFVMEQPLEQGGQKRSFLETRSRVLGILVDPEVPLAVVGANFPSRVFVTLFDKSPPMVFGGFGEGTLVGWIAYDRERNRVAAAAWSGPAEGKIILVWDLDDEREWVLGPADDAGEAFDGNFDGLAFLENGDLISASRTGPLRRWNLEDGSSEVLTPERNGWKFLGFPAASKVVAGRTDKGSRLSVLELIDLSNGRMKPLPHFEGDYASGRISPAGDIFAASRIDGSIRIGKLAGGKQHVLFGHSGKVFGLAFSPNGSRLATGDASGEIRVWPVPDVDSVPLYALPHAELLDRLDSFTNLRVVRNPDSPTGWTTEIGRFPGWADVPEW